MCMASYWPFSQQPPFELCLLLLTFLDFFNPGNPSICGAIFERGRHISLSIKGPCLGWQWARKCWTIRLVLIPRGHICELNTEYFALAVNLYFDEDWKSTSKFREIWQRWKGWSAQPRNKSLSYSYSATVLFRELKSSMMSSARGTSLNSQE